MTTTEHVTRLRSALRELHAMVWGECPSLLNEDSGGDARLDLKIRDLLASSPREPESGDGREALEEIKKLAAQYEADPVNAHDRPSSWDKLGALLEAIRRAAPRIPEPESR